MTTMRTNNHGGELEALAHALSVHLVREVGKAHIAVELFADDGGRGGFGLLGQRWGGPVCPVRGAVGGDGVAVGCVGHVRVRHLEINGLNARVEGEEQRIRDALLLRWQGGREEGPSSRTLVVRVVCRCLSQRPIEDSLVVEATATDSNISMSSTQYST